MSYPRRGSTGTSSATVDGSGAGETGSTVGAGCSAESGMYDRYWRIDASACSSSSASMWTLPLVSAATAGPPSSSASTSSPTAARMTGGPESATAASRRITTKWPMAACSAASPKLGPSTAVMCGTAGQPAGDCRNDVKSNGTPEKRQPRRSGSRPPSLSLRQMSGSPRRPAHSATRFCLRMLTGAVVPVRTVASTAMIATRRPSTRASPVTIQSPVVTRSGRRSSGSASIPSSYQEPGSMSCSMRSRAVWRPESWILATRSAPPPSSACRRRRSSSPRGSSRTDLSAVSVRCVSVPTVLPPFESWLAAFPECGNALGEVLCALQIRDGVDGVLVGLLVALVEHLLAHGERQRRALGDLLCQRLRGGDVLAGRGDAVDQAGDPRLLGAEQLAGQNHQLHPVQVGVRGPAGDARAGHEADGRLRRPHPHGLVGDDDVAHHRQLAAAADAVPGPRGDRRLGERLDGVHRAHRLAQIRALVAGVGQLAEALDVAADGEAAPRPVEHQDADLRVALGLREHVPQLLPEAPRHGVELLSPIQRRPADRPVLAVGQHGGRSYRVGRSLPAKRLVDRGTHPSPSIPPWSSST